MTKEEETERNKDEGSPYPCDYRCGLPSCILFPSCVVVSSLRTCLQKHRQQAADQMRLSASAVLLIEGARRDGLCSTKSLKSKLGNKSWSMLRSNDLVLVAAYLGWSKKSGAHISSIKGLPPAKVVLGLLRKVMLGSYVQTSFLTSKTPCTVREPRGLVTKNGRARSTVVVSCFIASQSKRASRSVQVKQSFWVALRTRHAQYKTDEGSLAAHAAHTWVTVWDDHEFASGSSPNLFVRRIDLLGLVASLQK